MVDAAWMSRHGYSTSLRSQYVTAGWLEQPARQVYRRKRGSLSWEQVVISLQTLLNQKLVVGGRTALEVQGFSHYLSHETREVHLYGVKRPPAWLGKLPLSVKFVFHSRERLFSTTAGAESDTGHRPTRTNPAKDSTAADLVTLPWGQWGWQLTLSSAERAILELLDELPSRESFEQVDALMEGLVNLRPKLLSALLARCQSVKVKRLFFFFADRHRHAWLARIDRPAVDLGKGKRLLVRGGVLDSRYHITVPKELHGVS